MVKLTGGNTLHKVHINQLRECYSNVKAEKGLLLGAPLPVLNKVIPVVSHQKPLSPAQSSPDHRCSPQKHTSPQPSLSQSQSLTNRSPPHVDDSNKCISSKGRVIKPTKRFTFSEFD